MSEWGRRAFGEPCRECGFSWSIETFEAEVLVATIPLRLATMLSNARGDERHPTLAWSVTAYVSHIGDNPRIWAERLACVSLGGSIAIATYDENALAAARGYEAIGVVGALWTLERSTRDWLEAVRLASPDLEMVHPERGIIRHDDVVRSNAHDAMHHTLDIERSLP